MKYKEVAFGFILAVLFLSLTVALPLVRPVSFNFNESISSFYNITINNSESASGNITMVNITLPSGFAFAASSNGSTSITGTQFLNSSRILSWSNTDALVMNVTNESFWFNATANTTTIGTFNISVVLMNSSWLNGYNISVTVNDTSSPGNVSFVGVTNASTSNVSYNYILINVSATDNFNVSTINITVYNSTRQQINNTGFFSSTAFLNVSNLSEGVYYYNATATDNAGNSNISETRSVVLDRTVPVVTLTQNTTARTESQVVVEVSVTNGTSGLYSCSLDGYSVTPSTWTNLTQHVVETKKTGSVSLACGQTVSRTATCIDNAGNSGSASISLSTTACSSDSVTGSSGGATNTTTSNWTSTYYQNTKALSDLGEVNQVLAVKERLGVKVSSALHYVGVKTISSSSTVIEVTSTPQNATFRIGDTKEFEVTGDNYYDISITLNSIKSSKANISVSEVHTAMTQAQIATSNAAKSGSTTTTTTNTSSTQQNSSITSQPSSFVVEAKKWMWWALGVLVVLIIAAVAWVIIRKRMRARGRHR